MKLDAFRVQNYKRIADTGWVSARALTVLVGKNEAGKSAVLRGLSKLKPSMSSLQRSWTATNRAAARARSW